MATSSTAASRPKTFSASTSSTTRIQRYGLARVSMDFTRGSLVLEGVVMGFTNVLNGL